MRIAMFVTLLVLGIPKVALSSERSGPPEAPPSQEQIREELVVSGPGSCDDVGRIRTFPGKGGMLGGDPAYDRIMVHISFYESCLRSALTDERSIQDVRLAPSILAMTVSDVAFALLVDAGRLEWGLCTPVEIAGSEAGAIDFYTWLKDPKNRKAWQSCIAEHVGS